AQSLLHGMQPLDLYLAGVKRVALATREDERHLAGQLDAAERELATLLLQTPVAPRDVLQLIEEYQAQGKSAVEMLAPDSKEGGAAESDQDLLRTISRLRQLEAERERHASAHDDAT